METSVIICCESHENDGLHLGYHPGDIVSSTQNLHFESLIRRLEEKYERALVSTKEEWQIKFESQDRTIARLTQELAETGMRLNSLQCSDQVSTQTYPLGSDSSTSSGDDIKDSDVLYVAENELPRTLVLDKGLLRGSQSDRGSNDLSSNSMLQDSDPLKITQPDHHSTNLLNDIAFDHLNQEMQKHNHQIASLQNEMISVLSKLALTQEEMLRLREERATDLEFIKTQFLELESKNNATQSALKLSEQSLFLNIDASNSASHLTKKEATELINIEGERLMRTWGAQFDDLTVYLQDNLDKQRASIAETRTSTFEHVDADALRRESFWNSQWKEILGQNRQYDSWIQELRDDQERSFLIIVDTLVSLKTKCQSISDRMDELEEIERPSSYELPTIRQGIEQLQSLSQSKFGKYDAKLQSLKNSVDHAMKDIEDITEDRECVQNILTSSVELFNSKIECSFDHWSKQFEGLEKRMNEKFDAGQKQMQSLNRHRREIEIVVTAMCKKIVDLSGVVENQLSELEALNRKINDEHNLIRGQMSSHGCVEGTRDDAVFKYMKVDRKKYKKILWYSRRNNGDLIDENCENEVEFYDLTFVTSKE